MSKNVVVYFASLTFSFSVSAAPLLCAGVTAYGALKKISQFLTGGKTINIIGCGGVGMSPLRLKLFSAN
jgi:D-arabinose 1-dehydrogenase-like Zn-dependent alcohol dehydrogenase